MQYYKLITLTNPVQSTGTTTTYSPTFQDDDYEYATDHVLERHDYQGQRGPKPNDRNEKD